MRIKHKYSSEFLKQLIMTKNEGLTEIQAITKTAKEAKINAFKFRAILDGQFGVLNQEEMYSLIKVLEIKEEDVVKAFFTVSE